MHECHRRHPLAPSPPEIQHTTCFTCGTAFVPSCHTLTCLRCNVSLCADCVLLYVADTAFPMYLANYGDMDSLRVYTRHRECATRLVRDRFMAAVYLEYQRFYNTGAYIRILEERASNACREIKCLKQELLNAQLSEADARGMLAELQNAQNRLAFAKLELRNARHRRTHLSSIAEN